MRKSSERRSAKRREKGLAREPAKGPARRVAAEISALLARGRALGQPERKCLGVAPKTSWGAQLGLVTKPRRHHGARTRVNGKKAGPLECGGVSGSET